MGANRSEFAAGHQKTGEVVGEAPHVASADMAVGTPATPQTEAPSTGKPQGAAAPSAVEEQAPIKRGEFFIHPADETTVLPQDRSDPLWRGVKGHVPPTPIESPKDSWKKVGKVSVIPAPKNGQFIPSKFRGPEPANYMHTNIDYDGTQRVLTKTQQAENEAMAESQKNWRAHDVLEKHHRAATPRLGVAATTQELEESAGEGALGALRDHFNTLSALAERHSLSNDEALEVHDRAGHARRLAAQALTNAEQHRMNAEARKSKLYGDPSFDRRELVNDEEYSAHKENETTERRNADVLKKWASSHLKNATAGVQAKSFLSKARVDLGQNMDIDASASLRAAAAELKKVVKHASNPLTAKLMQGSKFPIPNRDAVRQIEEISEDLKERQNYDGSSSTPANKRGLKIVPEKAVRTVRNKQGDVVGSAPTTVVVREPQQVISAREMNMKHHMAIALHHLSQGFEPPADTLQVIGKEGRAAIIQHLAKKGL